MEYSNCTRSLNRLKMLILSSFRFLSYFELSIFFDDYNFTFESFSNGMRCFTRSHIFHLLRFLFGFFLRRLCVIFTLKSFFSLFFLSHEWSCIVLRCARDFNFYFVIFTTLIPSTSIWRVVRRASNSCAERSMSLHVICTTFVGLEINI